MIGINEISEQLMDYRLIGMLLLVAGFVIYYLNKKSEENATTWKKMALEAQDNFVNISKSFVEISKEQEITNKKLIEIRERDILQEREFHKNMERRIEHLPKEVAKEIRLIPNNRTSAKT